MLSRRQGEQRVVLITGASSGIGQACAEHLARRGWRVFGTQRRPPQKPRRSGDVEMVAMDVDQDASVSEAVRAIVADAGRLDAVVNNAGTSLLGAVEDVDIEEAIPKPPGRPQGSRGRPAANCGFPREIRDNGFRGSGTWATVNSSRF